MANPRSQTALGVQARRISSSKCAFSYSTMRVGQYRLSKRRRHRQLKDCRKALAKLDLVISIDRLGLPAVSTPRGATAFPSVDANSYELTSVIITQTELREWATVFGRCQDDQPHSSIRLNPSLPHHWKPGTTGFRFKASSAAAAKKTRRLINGLDGQD